MTRICRNSFARRSVTAAAVAVLGTASVSHAVLYNATNPAYSATTGTGGLTDNYSQFTNAVSILNYTANARGTATYLKNGWFLTARHVVQNGGNYNALGAVDQMKINVYGQTYTGDAYVAFGSADVALIHVGGANSGQINSLSGIEKRQLAGPGNGLAQVGGFGVWGAFGSGTTNSIAFHRGFNTVSLSGSTLNMNANAKSRLVNAGLVMGITAGGDSGSGMWESNATSDQNLDLYDWSLTGVTQQGGGTTLGGSNASFGFLQAYANTIRNTVYPHAVLSWNAAAATTATATDGGGTWNTTDANFTDGTNYAFNGPERTEQAIFGVGNGAAGTVTLTSNVPVTELVFNAAGSGNYTIAGNPGTSLIARANSRITTNVDATISASFSGGGANGLRGFASFPSFAKLTKNGNATLTLTGNSTLDNGAAFYARAGTTVLAGTGSMKPGFYTSVAVYAGETATMTLKDSSVYDSTNQDFNLADFGGNATLNVQNNASLLAGGLYVGKGYGGNLKTDGTGNLGTGGTATLNQSGGTVTAAFVNLGTLNGASNGTYNLAGGQLRTGSINRGKGAATVNFDGGTLVATSSNAAFMGGLSRATVNAGGATIDTNGFNVTVAQPLEHAGTGVDGGLTKNGGGVLTLTGQSTYTGNTVINAGTLRVAQNAAVASYTFDNVSGNAVINGGSGGGLNGTLIGDAAVVGGGRFGNAVSLGGSGSVDVASGITDLGPNGSWTVSAWVKSTTAGSSILSKSDGGWASGNTVLYLGDGSGGGSGGLPSGVRFLGGFKQVGPTGTNVADGDWHLVTYVNDGGTFGIYTDGNAQPMASGTSPFSLTDVGGVVRLGVSTNTFAGDGAVNFKGLMDNVQFYGQALSASQVGQLFQGNTPTGSLPAGTNVTVADGATLDLNGSTQTVRGLSGAPGSTLTLSGGRIIVDSPTDAEFAGSISGGGGGLDKRGNGTLFVSGPVSYTGRTTVAAGTLRLAPAAQAMVLANDAAGMDVRGGSLVLDYTDASPADAVRTLLAAAYADATTPGVADSGGLFSSTATAALGLGYKDEAGQVTVRLTLFGDADLDGGVSINDFNALSANFGTSNGKVWTDGDFDYDGGVSINDFNLLAGGFGQSLPVNSEMWAGLLAFAAAHNDLAAFEAVTGVPEPTSLALLAAGTTLGLRRRRR